MEIAEFLRARFMEFLYIYAMFAKGMDEYKIANTSNYLIKLLIVIICTIFLYPMWLISIASCHLYKYVVKCILARRFGSKFCGILSGGDIIFAFGFPRPTISNVFFVDYKGSGDEFYAMASQHAFNYILSEDKFKCALKHFMGYCYLLKSDNMQKFDFIKPLHIDIGCQNSQRSFFKLIAELEFETYPLNDEGLVQFFISKRKVNFIQKDGVSKQLYPIYLQIDHTVGDGVALLNSFQGLLCDQMNVQKTENGISKDKTKSIKEDPSIDYAKQIKGNHLNINYFTREPEKDIFSKYLSGHKHIFFYTLDKPNSLNKIKEIKSRLPKGTSFTDVFLAVIGKSFEEYFVKHSIEKPKSKIFELTIFPNAINPKKYGKYVDFSNKLGIAQTKVPIFMKEGETLIDRIKDSNVHTTNMKNAMDIKINLWFMQNALPVIPMPISSYLIGLIAGNTIYSNLPGMTKCTMFNGCPVEEYYLWTPNVYRTGISYLTTSYDNRLQLALRVDKSVIRKYEDVELMFANVAKYIDELDALTKLYTD